MLHLNPMELLLFLYYHLKGHNFHSMYHLHYLCKLFFVYKVKTLNKVFQLKLHFGWKIYQLPNKVFPYSIALLWLIRHFSRELDHLHQKHIFRLLVHVCLYQLSFYYGYCYYPKLCLTKGYNLH